MARLIATSMAKKKVVEVSTEETTVPTEIGMLSIDYGREDLNNLARKVNEIIGHLNNK